jgi:hypothetical protein
MSRNTCIAAVVALALGGHAGAFAADEVTPDQLLKAGSDSGNWPTHHRD